MRINGIDFKIGADPEVFMAINGKFVSANDIIPGTKAEPYVVDRGAVQVDGMALEFNIDPAENFDEFQTNLTIVQEQLQKMLPANSSFLEDPTVFFDEAFYDSVPLEAKILGCDPDYNAYTMGVNEKPDMKLLCRTAGGHIHIGGFDTPYPTDPSHMETCGRLARIIDETIGIYSLLWDKDDFRRDMYGKAGSFRPKRYGMEYRSLSNKWVFNKSLVSFIYDGIVESLERMFDHSYDPDPECQIIINKSLRDHPMLSNKKAKTLLGVL